MDMTDSINMVLSSLKNVKWEHKIHLRYKVEMELPHKSHPDTMKWDSHVGTFEEVEAKEQISAAVCFYDDPTGIQVNDFGTQFKITWHIHRTMMVVLEGKVIRPEL